VERHDKSPLAEILGWTKRDEKELNPNVKE
jgi:hypothetical protein